MPRKRDPNLPPPGAASAGWRAKREAMYRQTDFDSEKAETICRLLCEGIPVEEIEAIENGVPTLKFKRLNTTAICETVGISVSTLNLWVARYPEFSAEYNRARDLYADRLMEEAIDIADDTTNDVSVVKDAKGAERNKVNWDNTNRAKLRVDIRVKYAAKIAPGRYGDRLEINGTINHNHTVETIDDKRLRFRNQIEYYKSRGGDVKALFQALGLNDVNLGADDFQPHLQGIPAKLLDDPKTIRIPAGSRSHKAKPILEAETR